MTSLVIYPVGLALLCTLHERSLLLAGILAVLATVTVLIDRREGDVVVLVGGALLGPVAEIVAVRSGVWTYALPDFLGIPFWLPVAWGLATLLIKRIGEGLMEVARKRRGD